MPKLIRGFQQRYPKIRFELVQGNHTFISNRMENGECDLLISSAKLESDAYEWIPMRTVPLYMWLFLLLIVLRSGRISA
ncbi:LysR substrate-binding domain-containing protein [Paenibacillus lautus]|uniref:LysR substrate-binding domain-containing protein n=1 Tax=Paenibacillus lautus TaxID=1401 RepID=UPI003D27778B